MGVLSTKEKTARISLYVTPACRAQLDHLWRETGRQKSEIVAAALAHYYDTLRQQGQIHTSP